MKNEKLQEKRSLVQGNISLALLAFAFPIFLGNVLGVALSWCDGYLLSRYSGDNAFAGLNVGGVLISLGSIFATAFPVGMGSLSSLYFAQGNNEKIRKNFCSSLILSLSVAVLIVGLTLALIDPFLPLLNLEKGTAIYESARLYAYVAAFSFFGSTLYSFLISYLRSLGEKTMPFVLIGVDTATAIGFDFLFLVACHLGVTGVALSALIAGIISDIVGFVYLFIAHPELRIHRGDFHFEKAEIAKQLRLSLPLALQLTVISLGGFWIQSAIDGLGKNAILALSALGKLTACLGLFGNGLNNAIGPFMAQNLGKSQAKRAKQGLNIELAMAFGFSILDGVILIFCYEPVLGIFVSEINGEILSYARLGMFFNLLVLAINPFYGSFRYVLGAINKPLWNLLAGLLQLFSQLLLVFVFALFWMPYAVIGAGALAQVLPAILLSILIIHYVYRDPAFKKDGSSDFWDSSKR